MYKRLIYFDSRSDDIICLAWIFRTVNKISVHQRSSAVKFIMNSTAPSGIVKFRLQFYSGRIINLVKKESAMTWIVKACKHLTLVLVLFAFLAVAGCEGTETREKVDDTVEELAGKKNLDRMDRMKNNINKAQQQQLERFKKIDESAEEK